MASDMAALVVMAAGALASRFIREFLWVRRETEVPEEIEEDEEIYPEVLEMAQERGVPYEEMLEGLRQAAQEWVRSLPWYTRLWLWLKQER